MSTTKELRSAAEELIDVLKLVDVQIVKGKEVSVPVAVEKNTTDEEIIAIIEEAAGEIQEGDELSDETLSVIDEIKNPPKKKEPVAFAKGKKPVVIIKEEEDDDEGSEIEQAEDVSKLFVEIEDAVNIKQLKTIISKHDVFKTAAKKLNAISDVVDLRDAMLDILDELPEVIEENIVVKEKSIVTKEKSTKPAKEVPAKGKKAVVPVKEEKEPKKEKAVKSAKEKKEKEVKEKRVTAYGFAIELLCSDPSMDMETLKKKIKLKGINTDEGNGLRSAHVIVKKIVKLLTINGFIK
jgi:hypothetical protein